MHLTHTMCLMAAVSLTGVYAIPTNAGDFKLTGCTNFSGVDQPVDTTNATNRLPAPSPGESIVRVALGVGTQNYSCTDRTKPPTQMGALAILYDADCLAIQNKDFLNTLPPMLVQTPGEVETMGVRLISQVAKAQLVVGVHYFSDPTTPVFDFRQRGGSGIFVGKVDTRMPAPVGSSTGKAPDNFGAVAWLKLVEKPAGGSDGYTEAYRLVTAGGAPPTTCDGRSDTFTIPYAAEYWFYK